MIITRRDIVTGKILDRNSLIRISILKNGKTSIDKNFCNGGRGVYILQSSIDKGLKKDILERSIRRFGGNIENIIDELLEVKNGKK